MTFNYDYSNMTIDKGYAMQLPAGEFKAKCLKIMEEVREFHTEVVITKHGKPVAKLIPVEDEIKRPIFGYLKNSVETMGDIVSPIDERWDIE